MRHLPTLALLLLLLSSCLPFSKYIFHFDQFVYEAHGSWPGSAGYRLVVCGNGNIIYDGQTGVKELGIREGKLAPREVSDLLGALNKVKFLTISDSDMGPECMTDMDTVHTSIVVDGKFHDITHNGGACSETSKRMNEFEQTIYRVTNTEKWIGTNADRDGLKNIGTYEAAFERFKSEAEYGDPEGQRELAWLFAVGVRKASYPGIRMNALYALKGDEDGFANAMTWWTKAAAQGDADAQTTLGILYHLGKAVEKDDARAAELWSKAAEQGYVRAQHDLGDAYQNGWGVKQDSGLAFFWYTIVLQRSMTDAEKAQIRRSLDDADRNLTGEEEAKINKEIEIWKPKSAKPMLYSACRT